MANDNGTGIFIPMEDTGFTPITDKDFRKEVLKKNPNAAVVNPDNLKEGNIDEAPIWTCPVCKNENKGSYESDIR